MEMRNPDDVATFVDDNGRAYSGAEAIAAADAHFAKSEREHRAAVARMRTKPQLWRAYKTRLRLGAWPAPLQASATRPMGRAPRQACNARTRGSRRSAVLSGQDPGDPDLDDEPPDHRLLAGGRL